MSSPTANSKLMSSNLQQEDDPPYLAAVRDYLRKTVKFSSNTLGRGKKLKRSRKKSKRPRRKSKQSRKKSKKIHKPRK